MGRGRDRLNAFVADARTRAAESANTRSRLTALSRSLAMPVETNPTQTAGYASRIGTLLDSLREDRTDAAGRAGASGMSPGLAMQAGAGARSQALVSGVRGATADAEASVQTAQARRMAALMQVLGMEADLDERDKDREERKRAARNQMLVSLGTLGLSSLLPPRPAAT